IVQWRRHPLLTSARPVPGDPGPPTRDAYPPPARRAMALIRVFSRDNGSGLARDLQLVEQVLLAAGHDVEAVGFGNEKGINTIRRHGLRVARLWRGRADVQVFVERILPDLLPLGGDRKSTRLNSSHVKNSYAVFCLKKKNLGRERYNIR